MQDPKRFWVRNKRIYNLELGIEKFFISIMEGEGGDLIPGRGPKAQKIILEEMGQFHQCG